jgi:hypothetical protein
LWRTLRVALAILCLVVLAISLVSSLRLELTFARFVRLRMTLRGEPGYRSDQMAFWFDLAYAEFLEEVRRRTPENATVAIVVPAAPDLYRFQGYYRLAPRRVVEERWMDEAEFVATYRTEIASGRGPGGLAIPGGLLWTRERR